MNGPPGELEFYFEFASTYSYLSVGRIQAVCEAVGLSVRWKPFLLGPIFAAQGWNDSPFNLQPAKGRYMWRDMERQCERYSLPFRRPSAFPRNGLLAARVAHRNELESWLPDFSRAVFAANFAEDRDIAQRDVIGGILHALGLDADLTLEEALSSENKQSLRERTERAQALGIFGAPTFVVGHEIYWGNDRMGDAVIACRLG